MSQRAAGSPGWQPSAGSAVPSGSRGETQRGPRTPAAPSPPSQGPLVAWGQKASAQGLGQTKGGTWQDTSQDVPAKPTLLYPCQHQRCKLGAQTWDPTPPSARETPKEPARGSASPYEPQALSNTVGKESSRAYAFRQRDVVRLLPDQQSHRPRRRQGSTAPFGSARSHADTTGPGILKQELGSGCVLPSLPSPRYPTAGGEQGRCRGGWQPGSRWGSSCWEQGHTAGSKLDRLFNTALAENTSRSLPAQEQPAARAPARPRAWGWASGDASLAGQSPGQKGKTQARDASLPQHTRDHLKSSSSTVKSSQEQKLLLPHPPALHRAEPSTTHRTAPPVR